MMLIAWVVFAFVSAILFMSALWVAIGYAGHFVATKAARPSLGEYVLAYCQEWWSNVRTWSAHPVAWLPAPRWDTYDAAKGIPIAMVHGYMMNRGCFFAMHRMLRHNGYGNLVYIEPRPLLAAIETQADAFADEVRKLSAWAGNRKVAIIGHSQGGLVARVAMVRHPDLPVALIISIGSPHGGTVLVRATRSPNGVQMRWGSPFLKSLPPPVVPFVSIYSDLDNIVFPKESSQLGQSIEVHGLGHHSLCLSPKVTPHVLAALANANG